VTSSSSDPSESSEKTSSTADRIDDRIDEKLSRNNRLPVCRVAKLVEEIFEANFRTPPAVEDFKDPKDVRTGRGEKSESSENETNGGDVRDIRNETSLSRRALYAVLGGDSSQGIADGDKTIGLEKTIDMRRVDVPRVTKWGIPVLTVNCCRPSRVDSPHSKTLSVEYIVQHVISRIFVDSNRARKF
jgi:hypothetical protein